MILQNRGIPGMVDKWFVLAGITAVLLLSSCATHRLEQGQLKLRQSFKAGDYSRSGQLLKELKKDKAYKSKDRVLYELERGTVNHFRGDHTKSIRAFSNAEDYIDQFFTKSVSKGIQSLLINDNKLPYNGEVYEDIYLNAFKSLSYLQNNNFESAMVEARRIANKLERAEDKFSGLAASLAEVDTTGIVDWETGEANVQNSPMSHYLAAIMYAKEGEGDDARIELDRMQKAFRDHQSLPQSRVEFKPVFEKVREKDQYNTLLVAFSGQGPYKEEKNIRIHIEEYDTYVKIALPELEMRSTEVEKVKVTIDGERTRGLPIIEEMDKVAREVYKIKEPIIYARAVVRGFLKAIGSNKITKETKEQDETAGKIAGLVTAGYQEFSEQADLRSWQTMPGKAYMNVVELPPGEHTIEYKYYSDDNELVYTNRKTVKISKNNELTPVESLYWN